MAPVTVPRISVSWSAYHIPLSAVAMIGPANVGYRVPFASLKTQAIIGI